MTQQRDTKAVAAKILEALKRDKRSKNQFSESIADQKRRRKLEEKLRQILGGTL